MLMKSMKMLSFVFLIVFLVLGCRTQEQSPMVEVPSTNTATTVPIALVTMPTFILISSPGIPTQTPTLTLEPSLTPTLMPPTAVPPTLTPIPHTATTPPIPSSTGEDNRGPIIHYFRAKEEEVESGDTIVLEWEFEGNETASITLIEPWKGTLTNQSWQVTTTGSLNYKFNTDNPYTPYGAIFSLYVMDEAKRGASARVIVELRCHGIWSFSPAPEGCPESPILSDAAEQHFEHGTMIWFEQSNRIYVLYDDANSPPKWASFADTWDESKPDLDSTLTPPSGLYQPARGFGLVWQQHPEVRNRLGWAIDQESSFRTIKQRKRGWGPLEIYLHALDGNVWLLRGAYGSEWEKIITDK